MVSRYNPETGRKQKVPRDSEEADLWPSRKPSKGTRGIIQRAASIGGEEGVKFATAALSKKVYQKVVRKAGRTIDLGIKRGIAKGAGKVAGAVATYGAGATTAAILTAAIGGYLLGSGIVNARANQEEKLDRALRALHAARREAEAKLGRALSKEEYRKIYDKYAELVARIKSGDPRLDLRPGAE